MPPSNLNHLPQTLPIQSASDPPSITQTIQSLHLRPHLEGGYFTETDLHPLELTLPSRSNQEGKKTKSRPASTTITYLLAPSSPVGRFHRNEGRTIHSLIQGRGVYVVIHPGLGVVETFVVGRDVANGERVQWVVEGGMYKGCFLPDGDESQDGMLISETVSPGFDWEDHDFLTLDRMKELLREDEVNQLKWMLQ